jgi:muramoyltetrapeptide carboxypeptidase
MKTSDVKAVKPPRLNIGDTIGIVAPAWSFDPDNFRRGVDKLKKIGFHVRYDRSIFSKYWSMAGYDEQRAHQINRMFADRQVKAILCAKAGYGSIRTIPYLDKKLIRSNPKIFVGYSDITIILSYLYKIANMVVFHGPVVSHEISEEMNPSTLDFMLRAITQDSPLGEMRFPEIRVLNPGRATGTLTGGNMSLLISAIGTPYDMDPTDKILFLEDIGEDLEVIDNYLMHMKLAGKLRRIKGIIFGRMVDCIDRSGRRYTIRDILRDILQDIQVPIIYGFPSGHRSPQEVNVTLPLGIPVTIDTYKKTLIANDSAVS